MNKYQKALDYINKSVCTLLALRSIQDIQGAKNLHVLQEAVNKANKYDDKETPKKPLLTWEYAKPKTRCKCSAGVEKYHSYCWNCGQALDWSDE